MRYKYVYAVFPRAYSKSFLSVMTLMLRAILYPRCNLFTTAGGKQQSSQILAEKVQDICTKIPALNREINWVRGGGTTISKDRCIIQFKNGSTIENVAARESSRGLRKHAGLIEECVGVDQKMLQEVIIPLMNVSRRCMDGTTQESEVLNQSQLYITTAGYRNSFSYDKLIQTLVQMIIEPDKAFIMGGTWRISKSVRVKRGEPVIKGCHIFDMANGEGLIDNPVSSPKGKMQRLTVMNVTEQGGVYHHSKRLALIEILKMIQSNIYIDQLFLGFNLLIL